MPSIKLTQAAVKTKPPAVGRIVYWDKQLPGFGLRITSSGAKSWVVTYRVKRKFVWETIGTVKKIPDVAEARKKARKSMAQAGEGINPVAERREREQQEASEAEDAEQQTVAHILERYLSRHVDANYRPRSAKETRRRFEKDVLLCSWGGCVSGGCVGGPTR